MQMSEREATPPEATRSGTTPLYQGGAAQHPLPDGGGTAPEYSTTPEYSTRPVAFRRPDPLAGLLLLLAGVAAGISLFLDWLAGRRSTGLDLVRAGFGDLGGLFSSGLWQPLMIVLGGGLLFLPRPGGGCYAPSACWCPCRPGRTAPSASSPWS